MFHIERPKDISPWGWAWVVVTVVVGVLAALLCLVPPIQEFVVTSTGWNWLLWPSTVFIFCVVWYMIGHNLITMFLANVKKMVYHAYGAMGMTVLIAIILLLPALGVAAVYIWDNGQVSFLLLGIAVAIWIVIKIVNYIRGRRPAPATISSK